MKELFEKRINRLKKLLGGLHEALLVTNEVNIGYFTGFFHSEGALLVTQNSTALLVDFRYFEAAQQKSSGCEVVCCEKLSVSVLNILTAESIDAVLVEASHMTLARFNLLKKKSARMSRDML